MQPMVTHPANPAQFIKSLAKIISSHITRTEHPKWNQIANNKQIGYLVIIKESRQHSHEKLYE